MSIINAITTPFSQLPLWRKKPTATKQSETVDSGLGHLTEDDREEDGFTFVGQSESERNTVYPHSTSISFRSPPPPAYQQVSTASSRLYHPDTDKTLQGTYEPRGACTEKQEIQGSSMGEISHNTIKDCMADVPFTLAPHILDPVWQDTSHVHCLPSAEISGFIYDFSLEKQVISFSCSSMEQNASEIAYDDKGNY